MTPHNGDRVLISNAAFCTSDLEHALAFFKGLFSEDKNCFKAKKITFLFSFDNYNSYIEESKNFNLNSNIRITKTKILILCLLSLILNAIFTLCLLDLLILLNL